MMKDGHRIWALILAMCMPCGVAHAVDVARVVGDWTLSVAWTETTQFAKLNLRQDPSGLRGTLRGELTEIELNSVRIEDESLLLRYEVPVGATRQTVKLEMHAVDGGMGGTLIAGDSDRAKTWPLQAARRGTPRESAMLARQRSQQVPVARRVPKLPANQAVAFLGAWQLALGPADGSVPPGAKVGLVLLEVDSHVRAAIRLGDGAQKTIFDVTKIPNGLRLPFDLNLGMSIFAEMDLVLDDGQMHVTITPPNQPAFMIGTGERKGNAEQLGIDEATVRLSPNVEMLGSIEDARVVNICDDVVFLQQGETLTALHADSPLLVPFDLGHIPERRRMVTATDAIVTLMDGNGRSLETYDVARLDSTASAGTVAIPDKPPWISGGNGSLAFVIKDDGYHSTHTVHTFDVSNPSMPGLSGSSDPVEGAGVKDLEISDSHLFLATSRFLKIVDITNPSETKHVGSYKVRLGPVRGIAVVDSIAYLATSLHRDASWLQIVDVSDPAAPFQIGSCRTTGGAQDVAVLGNTAFVADRADGLALFDVSDPAAPKRSGFYRIEGHCGRVKVAGPLVLAHVNDWVNDKNRLMIFRQLN